MSEMGHKRTNRRGPKSTFVRCYSNSGHVGGLLSRDLSQYLLMNLSGRDAIAGLDLKYVQIRWVTWKYYALRGESLFCSYSPSATIPSRTALSREFPVRKCEVFAAYCEHLC